MGLILETKKSLSAGKRGQTMMTTTSGIRPETQNKLLQLIEILSTIHPRKTPSSSCSPWWSWCLKNEMRCVVSAANKQNSQPLNWLSHHNNQD
jgi:hypothetical protein